MCIMQRNFNDSYNYFTDLFTGIYDSYVSDYIENPYKGFVVVKGEEFIISK